MREVTFKLSADGGSALIGCRFHTGFITRIKQIGGVWADPYWKIPAVNESLGRNLCKEIFFTDGSLEPTVKLVVDFMRAASDAASFNVGPIEVLRKYDRDSAPKVFEGCTVITGKLLSHGGSRANPVIKCSDDCQIRIDDVPISVALRMVEDEPNAYTIQAEEPKAFGWSAEEMAAINLLATLDPDRLLKLINEAGVVNRLGLVTPGVDF